MTTDQTILFAILTGLFALLIWGRWRYDLVAFSALMISIVAGVVPVEQAFSGFGHPATVIIALVLIVSRGLTNSGVIELVASKTIDASRALWAHIGIMSGVSAVLSAVMNNVAALALLMPVDLQAAKKSLRSPALTLMPLSFASILGGLITLIGTPPNIIIAAYREKTVGEPFSMFDFAPVGAACAVIGILFVTVIGWRLIPKARTESDVGAELEALGEYVSELKVMEESAVIGQRVGELSEEADNHNVIILGLIRNGQRLPGVARRYLLQPDDLMVIEGGPEGIESFTAALKLGNVEHIKGHEILEGQNLEMIEVVVPPGARTENRSVKNLQLLRLQGVSLMGVSRQGRRFREKLSSAKILAGDVLLLLGSADSLEIATRRLGVLPLAERGIQLIQRKFAGWATLAFAAAILLASMGLIYLPVALGLVVIVYVGSGIVPIRDLYRSIEWSVIVLLGTLIPIGQALESSGGTTLIAGQLVAWSAGYAPWVALTLLMIITMTLSDVMNNTATAVIAAPIAVDVATRLGANPDPFLMAVAVAASCAFLTPIGHKNNTLIMGPGGYHFGDYWRMGLPLEVLIILVAIPMILLVWPL
ncbi:MAG: SLC13 family permease [Rhodospirillaceae bacterium]|nr:SLC13 family permease [Rhodospirillaceae bacterium]